MPFHIPTSLPSMNQWNPSSSSSTRGTSSRHLPGTWDYQRFRGQKVRSMWLSPETKWYSMATARSISVQRHAEFTPAT